VVGKSHVEMEVVAYLQKLNALEGSRNMLIVTRFFFLSSTSDICTHSISDDGKTIYRSCRVGRETRFRTLIFVRTHSISDDGKSHKNRDPDIRTTIKNSDLRFIYSYLNLN
jgi:hypothetical protein